MNRNEGSKSWSYRRKLVKYSLAFCAFCILYVMIHGTTDVETGKSIISGCFDAAMVIINGYIFGAVWHDKGKTSDQPPTQ